MRVRAVATASSRGAAALRTLLAADLGPLARCFEDAPPATYRLRRDLALTLRRGADGTTTHVALRGREPLDPALVSCLRDRLAPHTTRALAPGQAAEVQLRVWMRF